jgi:signal transduction histidine kinase
MDPDYVKLDLKVEVMNSEDKPFKQIDKVKDRFKTEDGKKVPKTEAELVEEAPSLTRGDALIMFLSSNVKPDSVEESDELNVLVKSIRNKIKTANAEWEVDTNKINTLLKYMGKVQLVAGSQMSHGDICVMLREAKEMISKQKSDSLKA